MKFLKAHGAGNDFILIDNRADEHHLDIAIIRKLCDRRLGVGADGLIELRTGTNGAFRMAYFNADGSVGEMCGNGARCVVDFARSLGLVEDSCSFDVLTDLYHARIVDNRRVRLMMQKAKIDNRVDLRPISGESFVSDCLLLDTGVPHLVVSVEAKLEHLDVLKHGRSLRNHPVFAPAGANINFVTVATEGTLDARVYERGVEAETLACGTGAVAAAVFAAEKWGWVSPITVVSAGGDLLIEFDEHYDNMYLTGPVERVFWGEYLG